MPKTVLVVEDNELNMKLFHDLLEASGYTGGVIRSIQQDVAPRLIEYVNDGGRKYDYVIGPRLGRSVSKERPTVRSTSSWPPCSR